ncbi:glycosyl hydrolase family 18 protein [Aureivirga sp. CE67]|uniref:glycosyl hydrolase family 18 protein n=1 Tax=Aureivirga sp. CE67 TaxID=1788983 RepID=UPI0018CAAEAE|nr:glycosyl hydrolase family 18 protein [Aureivirga sp. CE67]
MQNTSRFISYYCGNQIALKEAISLPYTHIIIAFLFTKEASPMELVLDGGTALKNIPPTFTNSTKEAIKDLQNAGKKVMISFGGGAMHSDAYKGIVGKEAEMAELLVGFMNENNLDGIDLDFEDTSAFKNTATYDGRQFLIDLTLELKKRMDSDKEIAHAPQPPYFRKGTEIDGYVAVMEKAGHAIDFVNVQYYNNTPWSSNPAKIIETYSEFNSLAGMSAEKHVLGFPVTEKDAGSGYLPAETIVSEIVNPLKESFGIGGVMNWQFSSDVDGKWAIEIGYQLTEEDELI